jgi:hypothetical protein
MEQPVKVSLWVVRLFASIRGNAFAGGCALSGFFRVHWLMTLSLKDLSVAGLFS